MRKFGAQIFTGPHAMLGATGLDDWMLARPSIAVLAGSFPFIQSPHTLLIGRATLGNDSLDPDIGDPLQQAERYFYNYVLPTAQSNRHIKTWVSQNEPRWDNSWDVQQAREAIRWYAKSHKHFASLCYRHELRPGIGQWSVGTPSFPGADTPTEAASIFNDYGEALAAVDNYRGIITRHSYGWHNEWLSLRHRADYRIFKGMGFANTKIATTEAGAEMLLNIDPPMRPFREQFPNHTDYMSWILQYELEQQKDWQYHLGSALFTIGTGGSGAWNNYDVAGTSIPSLMQTLPKIRGKVSVQRLLNIVGKLSKPHRNMIGLMPNDLLDYLASHRDEVYLGPDPIDWGLQTSERSVISTELRALYQTL